MINTKKVINRVFPLYSTFSIIVLTKRNKHKNKYNQLSEEL